MVDLTKEKLITDVIQRTGYGFMLGTVIGTCSYFAQGSFYAPRKQRLIGGIFLLRDKATLLGGSVAMWCGCFALVAGSIKLYRHREDEWNETIGGAFTAFVINIRGGVSMALS